jgi:hypothetical protein
MTPELTAEAVAARLRELRRLYLPEGIEAARERLARECPAAPAEPFALAVARALAELRALCELARHLHAARNR